MTVQQYSYNREEVRAGILHIGVGNFHRAHLEFFTNQLLENPLQRNWGVCGVMLLPQDRTLYENLKSQGNEYILTVCGRTGQNQAYRIGSLVELLWSGTDSERILDKFADGEIRVITMTITQGGYNIDKATGEFILTEGGVVHDIACPAEPQTVFGYMAEGLRRRRDAGAGPVTILSCDNLQHNGNTTRKALTSFLLAQDKELLKWVEANVSFPNSMVDRITPATKPEDVIRLNAENGTNDSAPVYCEDFIQWVVEDNFMAGRPAWDSVGAQFTGDVTKWENTKLSLLNSTHTFLSYPSFLCGYRKVDKAMGDERIRAVVRQYMDIDITPYVPVPDGANLDEYKRVLLERFANKSVSDQVARLCANGLTKIPVFLMPNLSKMLRDGAELTRVAFLFAAYRHYLKYKVDDNGDTFDILEFSLSSSAEAQALVSSDEPIDFLSLNAFGSVDLKSYPAFVSLYLQFVESIRTRGVMGTLESIL